MADEFDDPGEGGFYDNVEEELPSYDDPDEPEQAPQAPMQKPKATYRKVQPQAQAPQPQPRQAPRPVQRPQPQQQAQPQPAQQPQAQPGQDRFIPFEMPKRVGLFDREENRAIIEDEDMQRAIMAMLADIKNQLYRIELSLA